MSIYLFKKLPLVPRVDSPRDKNHHKGACPLRGGFVQRAMVPLHKGMAPTFSIGAITARNGLRASSPGIWDEPLGEQIYLTQNRDVKMIVGTFLRTNLLPLAA